MAGNEMMDFTPALLAKFKVAYKAAVDANADTFEFEGRTFVIGYAKYLIEFLDEKFKGPTP